ncbi:MAG: hypothetical protein JRF33_17805 [Deltaproteobacteria bacterium]|nr:hypothetical protein [Deltaproteobacteria bacterium]
MEHEIDNETFMRELAEAEDEGEWMTAAEHAETCYQEGLSLAAAHQNGADGLDSFRLAHKWEPKNPLYAAELALALRQAGEDEQAKKVALLCLNQVSPAWLNEAEPHTSHRVALLHSLVLDEKTEALKYYAAAFEKDPEEAELRVAYAISLAQYGEEAQAAGLVESLASAWAGQDEALSLKQARLMAQMAHVLSSQDQIQAGVCIQKALAADPNSPGIRRTAGALAFNLQDFSEAMTQYRKASELAPNYDLAWGGLQASMLGLGWNQEAVDLGREILKTWPEFTEVRFNLAAACLNQGWYEEADDELTRYLALSGDDALAHVTLGLSYAVQGRAAEARAEQARALALDGKDPEVLKVSDQIDGVLAGGGGSEKEQTTKALMLVMLALLARQASKN